MTITVNGREWEIVPVKDMTEKELDKYTWTHKYLKPLLVSLGRGIVACEYYNVEHELEIVRVTYDSGAHRDINVSMDSKAAIVEDIYKQGAIY